MFQREERGRKKNLKGNLKNAETKHFLKKLNSCLKWKLWIRRILVKLQLYESISIQDKQLLADGNISCSQCCTWHSWTLLCILLLKAGCFLCPVSQLSVSNAFLPSWKLKVTLSCSLLGKCGHAAFVCNFHTHWSTNGLLQHAAHMWVGTLVCPSRRSARSYSQFACLDVGFYSTISASGW